MTPDRIQRCLDENNGVLELTWRALGLSNRFALIRLLKKYQLEVRVALGRLSYGEASGRAEAVRRLRGLGRGYLPAR